MGGEEQEEEYDGRGGCNGEEEEGEIRYIIASNEGLTMLKMRCPPICFPLPLQVCRQVGGGTGSTSQLTNLSLCPMVMLNMIMVQHQVKAVTMKFNWKIEIGHYLAHSQYNSACLSNGLNIGVFQFSSQISVTLISMFFTPPLVNPIYQQLSC